MAPILMMAVMMIGKMAVMTVVMIVVMVVVMFRAKRRVGSWVAAIE